MKRIYRGFILVFAILCAFSLSGCDSIEPTEPTESFEEAQARRKYEYFDVVEMINNEKYEDAMARIDEVYSDADYSKSSGYNKADLLCKLYEKQEMYDEAMDELLMMVSDESYLNRIEEIYPLKDENLLTEKDSVKMTVNRINVLCEKVSPEKKNEALSLINQGILADYVKEDF